MNFAEYSLYIYVEESGYVTGFDVICPLEECKHKIFDSYRGSLALGDLIDIAYKHFKEAH